MTSAQDFDAQVLADREAIREAWRKEHGLLGTGGNQVPFTRALMQATSVEKAPWDDETEHLKFSRATPVGHMELNITNPAMLGKFIPGRHYHIDISEV